MPTVLFRVPGVQALVDEVSEASRQQTAGIDQVSQALTQMEKVTQGIAATAQESAATSEELNAQASVTMETLMELNALVGRASDATGPIKATSSTARPGKTRTAVVALASRRRTAAPSRAEDALPLEGAGTGTYGNF